MEMREIKRILSHDFAADAREFHDRLLERCLRHVSHAREDRELDDDDLEMLAAAGEISEAMGAGADERDGGRAST